MFRSWADRFDSGCRFDNNLVAAEPPLLKAAGRPRWTLVVLTAIVATTADRTDIAAEGDVNALILYSSAYDTTTWSSEIIASAFAAFSAPAMIDNAGGVDVAVQGNNNALDIYWAPNGSDTWDTGTVAAPGTTFSAPAMALNGGVDMTAAGPNGSLYDYYAPNGSANWSVGKVAPPGSVG